MDKFEDIIGHKHHTSEKHPPMTLHDRAAQFAPFAALTGYDEEIEETAVRVLNAAVMREPGNSESEYFFME